MKLAIIIPAYNESKVLGIVLKTLPKKLRGIEKIISIVIDDGSSDGTFTIAKKNADYAVKHLVNLGVGSATSTGFSAAKKLDADIVVTIDADGQHDPKDIEALILPILNKEADIVIGTRMKDAEGMPVFKIFGNWLMNLITFMLYGKWTSDSQSGMRAFSKKAISKINLHAVGYEVCTETIGEARRNNLKLVEVPIRVIYTDYSKVKGQSWLNGINILTKIISIKLAGRK